jgi:hypothetical protein
MPSTHAILTGVKLEKVNQQIFQIGFFNMLLTIIFLTNFSLFESSRLHYFLALLD